MTIHHVALWVSRLEEMREFYMKFFGATAGERYTNAGNGFSSYFLSFDGGASLELMFMESIPANRNSTEDQYRGLIHIAISTGSEEVVRELTETLREAGLPVVSEPRRTGDGFYESCILDPEGNRVELTI